MRQDVHEIVIAELPEHLRRLWRYGLLLSRDPDMADDLVQATCLRALERSAQFTLGTRLDRWLFTILRSVWLNELRARRVRTGRGRVDAEAVLVEDGRVQTEANILAAQVLRKMLDLPEEQRETVLLVYAEGYTYREAAALLGIPIGTVMSRLATARGKLGALCQDDKGERANPTEESQ